MNIIKNTHEKQTAYLLRYGSEVEQNVHKKQLPTTASLVGLTVNQRQEIAFPDVFVPVISSKWRFEAKINFQISGEHFEIFNEVNLILCYWT